MTTDFFGPTSGFPFIATASDFKVEFLGERTIDFDIEIKDMDGKVLASTTKKWLLILKQNS